MNSFFTNTYFLITLTFVIFVGARGVYKRSGFPLLNPILVTIILLILFLVVTGVPYERYAEGGAMIEFWLKPAVVALGVPLYKQLSTIRRQLLPILLAEIAGCLAGLISVVLLAELFGATREVIISLAPKSVTTPIAIEVSRSLGGIPPLTAAVVCAVGIFGGMSG
ncbi:MAG: LrgB family protein, partial [Duncaniella sp.]|nr:LrgB family protein [Duncaniella sp.]